MNHYASPHFWFLFRRLPAEVQKLAEGNFVLLSTNERHPSLHFKRVGKYWSVRIGLHYRALAIDIEDGVLWSWIGTHADYDSIIQ